MEAAEEAEGLRGFQGEWDMSMVLIMADGSVVRGKAIIIGKLVSVGRGIHLALTGELEGSGEYEENDLVSFFKEDGRVHFFSVTSTDLVHDYVGNWTDRSTLVVDWRGRTEGKASWERIIFTWSSPNELFVNKELTVEGRVTRTAEYRAVHRGLREPVPIPLG